VVGVLGPHIISSSFFENASAICGIIDVLHLLHGELAPPAGEKYLGVLGFDRYVRCRVAGRGRQLASLNICHKKTSQ
jgi:hypothetical protein